jgi:DNA-directed RNA polymerase specialized sigma24 family protein
MWEPSQKLQDGVAYLARRWSWDDYSQADDLYQEGMLAIWLKGDTEAPWSHQLRTAQDRMLSVRKLGKSVDGKLDRTYQRDKTYLVLPLDGDGVMLDEDPDSPEEPIPDPLDLEEQVVSRLTVLETTSFLTPQERHLVELRCLRFTMKEIAAVEGVSNNAVRKRFGQVKAKVRMAIQDEHPEVNGVMKSEKKGGE